MTQYVFSDQDTQYKYLLDVENFHELKKFTVGLKYEGSKFPNDVASRTEIFLNEAEWKRFKDIINSID
jgi:hypothetical protein